MIILSTLTAGLVLWIVAWAFGIKAFDAFVFTAFITFCATAVQFALPTLRRRLHGEPGPPG